MNYKQAHDLAIKIRKELEPFCFKIDLAGEIAREFERIKTITFFLIPKRTASGDFHPVFIDWILMNGCLFTSPFDKNSEYIELMLPDDIVLDFFIPASKDYYYFLIKHDAGKNFMYQID